MIKLASLTSKQLEQLVADMKRRDRLEAEISRIDEKWAWKLAPVAAKEPAKTFRKTLNEMLRQAERVEEAIAKPARKKTPRGALKEKILAVLAKAGPKGLRANEVAAQVGTTKGSASVWFATAAKKVRGIKKVAPGRYALAK